MVPFFVRRGSRRGQLIDVLNPVPGDFSCEG